MLAGLVSIPREFYEAAEVDGAGSWGRFWHVTLPLLKPVLAVVILFSTIFTFSDFNIVYVLTRGGPVNTTHLFATLAYQVGLQGGNLGQGAAISLFMLPMLRNGGLLPAPLHPERVTMIAGVRSPGAGCRSIAFGYANLVPFVFFALFPFYFMLVTSFKIERRAVQPEVDPAVDPERRHPGPLPVPVRPDQFLTWIKNSLIISVASTASRW